MEKAEREAKQKQEEAVSQHRTVLQQKIIDALEASGLPRKPFFASRMAFHMAESSRRGWDAPQEMIVQTVKNEYNDIFSQVADEDAEYLIKLLGEKAVNKIRQHDLKRLREKRALKSNPFSQEDETTSSDPSKRISMSDVNENLRKMRMGLL